MENWIIKLLGGYTAKEYGELEATALQQNKKISCLRMELLETEKELDATKKELAESGCKHVLADGKEF